MTNDTAAREPRTATPAALGEPTLADVLRALRALADSTTAEPAAHINHVAVVEAALAESRP
jgi:hypothetical protein